MNDESLVAYTDLVMRSFDEEIQLEIAGDLLGNWAVILRKDRNSALEAGDRRLADQLDADHRALSQLKRELDFKSAAEIEQLIALYRPKVHDRWGTADADGDPRPSQ